MHWPPLISRKCSTSVGCEANYPLPWGRGQSQLPSIRFRLSPRRQAFKHYLPRMARRSRFAGTPPTSRIQFAGVTLPGRTIELFAARNASGFRCVDAVWDWSVTGGQAGVTTSMHESCATVYHQPCTPGDEPSRLRRPTIHTHLLDSKSGDFALCMNRHTADIRGSIPRRAARDPGSCVAGAPNTDALRLVQASIWLNNNLCWNANFWAGPTPSTYISSNPRRCNA